MVDFTRAIESKKGRRISRRFQRDIEKALGIKIDHLSKWDMHEVLVKALGEMIERLEKLGVSFPKD